jgi:hypothetical protein
MELHLCSTIVSCIDRLMARRSFVFYAAANDNSDL